MKQLICEGEREKHSICEGECETFKVVLSIDIAEWQGIIMNFVSASKLYKYLTIFIPVLIFLGYIFRSLITFIWDFILIC